VKDNYEREEKKTEKEREREELEHRERNDRRKERKIARETICRDAHRLKLFCGTQKEVCAIEKMLSSS